MLSKFEVTNFKNFTSKLVFDLKTNYHYDFNGEVIQNEIIKDALIFGRNGSGKSNLAIAIFDINIHLTDNARDLSQYKNYLSLASAKKEAIFSYYFKFEEDVVNYSYKKNDAQSLNYEKLQINGKTIIEYNYQTSKGFSKLRGSENLQISKLGDKLSLVKYVSLNSILEDNEQNRIFQTFIAFVNKMLLFTSESNQNYQGFTLGVESIANTIIKAGRLADFQKFLARNKISALLFAKEINGENYIYQKYRHGESEFFEVASAGTKSLARLYSWFIQFEQASLVCIDEFDAFYHFELSETVVKALIEQPCQFVFTTHNNNLITNSFLRPDCLYILNTKKQLKSLANLTPKELRQAHNLQKMYKAGAFEYE